MPIIKTAITPAVPADRTKLKPAMDMPKIDHGTESQKASGAFSKAAFNASSELAMGAPVQVCGPGQK